MLNGFKEWAKKNGWNIFPAKDSNDFPDFITERYTIPENWAQFIRPLEVCENNDATVWFVTPWDFRRHENGFRWNEFELMSLEWCDGDSAVTEFWDRHIPVVQSVKDGYSYYAINTENGKVVYGCEPEFEEAETVADSFEDFIAKIIAGEIKL